MSGTHSQASGKQSTRIFLIAIGLNILIVAGETLAGFIGHSTALLADAGHNLSDILSLVLAGGAMWLAHRPSTLRRTYGFRRATILASLTNALLLILVSGALAYAGIVRILAPVRVEENIVIAVAAIAVVGNALTAMLFMQGQKHDLNLRGAFLHMAADAAVSLGVVFAGIGILITGWDWLDPAMSLVIVLAILWSTWGLLRESFDLSLDAVPGGIDTRAVEDYLCTLPGVDGVHHLHVWAMSTTETALTAHLVKPDGQLDDALLREIDRNLHERFGIGHAAIQLESGDHRNSCDITSQY